MRCEQELCENWGGDGDVCACSALGVDRPAKPVSCHECGHATVEYRAVVIDQAGSEGTDLLACGDSECVFQAVANLLAHTRDINGVLVQQWVA